MQARREKWTAPPYKANQGVLYKVWDPKLLKKIMFKYFYQVFVSYAIINTTGIVKM
jgi:hypothetical protein